MKPKMANRRKRSREMMDKFSRHLECPVCQEIMKNVHIHMCKQGHSVCEPCYTQMKNDSRPFKCSVCRGPMSKVRNISLESLVNDAPFKCDSDDCQFIGTKEDLAEHNKICEYRPQSCPAAGMNACDWSGNIDEMIKHLHDEHHPLYFSEKHDTEKTQHSTELRVRPNFRKIDTKFPPRVVTFNSEHFIISARLATHGEFECIVRHLSNKNTSGDVEHLEKFSDYIWTAKVSNKCNVNRNS